MPVYWVDACVLRPCPCRGNVVRGMVPTLQVRLLPVPIGCYPAGAVPPMSFNIGASVAP